MSTTLYETDFYAWTKRQAELLRAEEFEQIDWDNLIEEIDSLGAEQLHKVESHHQASSALAKMAISAQQTGNWTELAIDHCQTAQQLTSCLTQKSDLTRSATGHYRRCLSRCC